MPERRTEHEYDEKTGRLVASTEYVESEWDPEQQAIMVALSIWKSTRCQACGGDPDDCQTTDAEFAWKALGPKRCWKTHTVRRRERQFLAGKTDEIAESLLVGVERQG